MPEKLLDISFLKLNLNAYLDGLVYSSSLDSSWQVGIVLITLIEFGDFIADLLPLTLYDLALVLIFYGSSNY